MTILTITGTIDFAELWPGKKSDADTMHMDVKPGAFRVQKSPRGPSKVTRVFDSATMKLPGKMQPIIAG